MPGAEYTRLPSELLDLTNVLRRGAIYAASDVLLCGVDGIGTTKSTTLQKERTIYIPKDVFKGLCATLTEFRIKFDIKTENAGTVASGQIYKNGAAVGTLRTNNTTSYVTKSQDIKEWDGGDTIELWTKTSSISLNCYIKNFRIYGDETLLYQADVPKWS